MTTRGQTLTLTKKCANKVAFEKKNSRKQKEKWLEFLSVIRLPPQLPRFTKSPRCYDFFKGDGGTAIANYRRSCSKERNVADVL